MVLSAAAPGKELDSTEETIQEVGDLSEVL